MTPRQSQLLDFVIQYQAGTGVSPSTEEMRAELKLASKSGIVRLLNALEDLGRIRRMRNHARAIEVLKPSPRRPTTALFIPIMTDPIGLVCMDPANAKTIPFSEIL